MGTLAGGADYQSPSWTQPPLWLGSSCDPNCAYTAIIATLHSHRGQSHGATLSWTWTSNTVSQIKFFLVYAYCKQVFQSSDEKLTPALSRLKPGQVSDTSPQMPESNLSCILWKLSRLVVLLILGFGPFITLKSAFALRKLFCCLPLEVSGPGAVIPFTALCVTWLPRVNILMIPESASV